MVAETDVSRLEFHHVCVIASDYQKAVQFYVDYMGFEIYRESYSYNRNAKKLELYSEGKYVIELFVKEDGMKSAEKEAENAQGSGLDHVSFLTSDVEKMMKRLEKFQVPVTKVKEDKSTGKKYGFCWDPDGTKIEFYEI